jgi:hypothetical protein
MTLYLCLKDLAYVPYYGDGSNSQEAIDWTLKHRNHEVVKIQSEFVEGVAVPA